jgi:hypothetical protein
MALMLMLGAFLAAHSQSLVYAGPVEMTLRSQGSESETRFESGQLSCRYTTAPHKLLMLVKTDALAAQPSTDQQAVLDQVLLSASNRLLSLDLDLGANVSSQIELEAAPLQIAFNGKTVEVPAHIELNRDAQTLTFSLELSFSLQQLGLVVPPSLARIFSDTVRIEVSNGTLTFRG